LKFWIPEVSLEENHSLSLQDEAEDPSSDEEDQQEEGE